nr:PREDICTED: uncharacterized protein LOC106705203 isoform X2 [Latimeria chalumnae]|eukprot:XP_014349464.1 PREDICTED: uncharacterized protein LOC106705203 isoform X2 [Latimeria chalumnae]
MDNCDLEKIAISPGKLEPPFKPSITSYKVILASNVDKITLDILTSDSGSSYRIIESDNSTVIILKDGKNVLQIEVTAEDGTMKKYTIEVTKLSASLASLKWLVLVGDLQLIPPFDSAVYEYSCTVPFCTNVIKVQPTVQDKNMKVTANGDAITKPVLLAVGDTLVQILVSSADGTKSQVYQIVVTRLQLPCVVSFTEANDQIEYECPMSLTAFYRPVTIRGSSPKHTFSAPYIDLLSRRSKIDPLDEKLLAEDWRIPDYELDKRMSGASVRCCFAYRGCKNPLTLSDLGLHIQQCTNKPPATLDPQPITESEWYKTVFASPQKTKTLLHHTVQVRHWEKRLQQVLGDRNYETLCSEAEKQIELYKCSLPKPGDVRIYEKGSSPLDALKQAASNYSSAVNLRPKKAQPHFLLGMVLEEYYYAAELYGLKQKGEDDTLELKGAKAAGKEDEILAICKIHGCLGKPTLEQQLKALDVEFQHLKDHGQSARADYVQSLFAWKSKQASKDAKAGVAAIDEENPLDRALLKYLDALSLSLDDWQYNFHVGRLLLQQGKSQEALKHLQISLGLRPASPVVRFYTGLTLLEQENGPGAKTEAVMYLQQGLEQLLMECIPSTESHQQSSKALQAADLFSVMNTLILRGVLKLGTFLSQKSTEIPEPTFIAEDVYHIVTDLAAKALTQCPYQGVVSQQLEWVLLEAHYSLLESLVHQPQGREFWITKRCEALSALMRLTSIPSCKKLIDMQEKVCQLGVITAPCNSHALYLLGMAQLAQYDNDPSSESAWCSLEYARLSFQTSISLEQKPAVGPPKKEITDQKWWRDWKAVKSPRASKQSLSTAETKADSTMARPSAEKIETKRKSNVNKATVPTISKHATSVKGGAVSTAKTGAAKGSSNPAARGRSVAASSAKTSPTTSGAPTAKTAQAVASPTPEVQPTQATEASTLSPVAINPTSYIHHLGLARALCRTEDTFEKACQLYHEVITMAPEVHDAYIELAAILSKSNPLAAVDVYCKFPVKPIKEQTFDDAFITGEIVNILMKKEKYNDPRLAPNMIAYAKVMGIGCLEKYINILEEKMKTNLLKIVYAGFHDKSVDDKDLQDFFCFKCWN